MKPHKIFSRILLASLLLVGAQLLAQAVVGDSGQADSTARNRILVIMVEKDADGANAEADYLQVQATVSENSVIEILLQNGFDVIDPGLVRQQLKLSKLSVILHGDEHNAADVAREFGARMMILGKASVLVATGTNLYGMKSCQATLQARAIDVNTGSVVATASATSAKPHVDAMAGSTLAIQEAAQKVAKELITKIRKESRK